MINGRLLLALALAASPDPLPDLLERLAPGLAVEVLARAGDELADGTLYAPQNDLTAFVPTGPDGRGYLLVGHELRYKSEPDGLGGRFTRFEVSAGRVVGSQTWVAGMHFNCAGSVTPWNTILTNEENPHEYLPRGGESGAKLTLMDRITPTDGAAQVGWVYEIDPLAADSALRAIRRPALGRFSHESAVVHAGAVYLTEDADKGHFFKFVPDRPRDLSAGRLFAYRAGDRTWLPIQDVHNARPEATAAGATPYNRLEDLKVGPDGRIYLAETGAYWQGDDFGRILRFDPATGAMEVWLEGDGKVMAQPDNLLFDPQGRLLVAEDQYPVNVEAHGANELLRVTPDKTIESLLAVRRDGEPSGPSWGPDGVLYLSVMAGSKSGLVAIIGL